MPGGVASHPGTTPGPPPDSPAANHQTSHLKTAQVPFKPIGGIYILGLGWLGWLGLAGLARLAGLAGMLGLPRHGGTGLAGRSCAGLS